MKQLELQSRLGHVASACEKILRYTAGKTYDDYFGDDLLASAVERQLTIVGEVGDFPRIIAFRNQLVHNYPDN